MGAGRPRLKESNVKGVAAYLDFSAPPLLTLGVRAGHDRRLIIELVASLSPACLATPLYSALNHQRNGHLSSLIQHKTSDDYNGPDNRSLLFVICEG